MSGVWFGDPASGGCVTVNSKTKQSEVISRASEVEMNFFFNIQ